MFYLLLFLGLLVRTVLIPVSGFKADVAFWKGWGLAAADKGVLWMMTNTNYNYPPGFSYVLWIVNKFYALFKNSHDINEYWLDGNVFYLFLIKLITIAADLLIVWLIIKMTKVILNSFQDLSSKNQMLKQVQHDKKPFLFNNLGKVLALFYFLNPAVIYDGVVWGQVDQFGLALFLSSAYLLLVGKPKWASVVFTISCLIKFQNIIFIPLFLLFIWRKYSFETFVKSLAVTTVTFLLITSPFVISKQMDKLIWLLTVNSDWFPWYSLNAFNIWWIKSGLNGMGLVDKHLVIGIISAKQLGLFMFIFAYFIGIVTVLISNKEKLYGNFLLACTLVTFAFFHLLTQSHERYLFPVMGLLPILFVYYLDSRFRGNDKSSFLTFSIFYFLLSTFFFLNMYISMGWNYPDQVVTAFTREQTLQMSFWISIIQTVLFTIFVFWFYSKTLIKNRVVIVLFGICILLFIFAKNAPFLLKKPITLTSMKPVSYRQDYLEPQYNKTVESARGIKFWNRLSVNYYFYDKGIGTHADSEIMYHLGRKFTKFTTDYGIDTEADVSAKAYFSVWADGKELFRSKEKGRFDKPESVTLNVVNVNYLLLKITKVGESNYGAHVDWLNPILTR